MVRTFWLLNLVLLLLFGWTLAEEVTLAVEVKGESCTARVPGRYVTIPCPGLANGGVVGLYHQARPAGSSLGIENVWRWLAPGSAWKWIAVRDPAGEERWTAAFGREGLAGWQANEGGWRVAAGELRATTERAVLQRREAEQGSFIVEARLRRLEENAGILLLEPDGRRGWVFIAVPQARQGIWWRWEEGRPVEPLVGMPLPKPLLAQSQALLRQVLLGHQGALLVLAVAWGLSRFVKRLKPLRRTRIERLKLLQRSRPLHTSGILIALILLVFLAAGYIAGELLERIPHVQDDITYLFQAQTLARGRLWAAAPPLPAFFEQEFLLVRDGRWFGKYPPGFPLLLAVGVWPGGPWLVSPWLAALTIPLLYQLSRGLYGQPGGLATGRLAALLALVSPFFLVLSGSLMAHAAELFWVTLFMVSWLRGLRTGRGRWAVLAGVSLGMVFLTRQLSVVAGLPFAAVTAWGAWRAGDASQRARLIGLAGRLAAAAISCLLLLWGYQWAVTGDPFQDPRLLYWSYDRLGLGQDIGEGQNLFRLVTFDEQLAIEWYRDPNQPPRGHTLERGLYNAGQNWQELARHLFGWLPPCMRPKGADMRIHTHLDWGLAARFYLLDTRQYRSWQACPRKGRRGGSNTVDIEQCPRLPAPGRSMLGRAQERWLEQALGESRAAWNLVAQTTSMAQFDTRPGPGRRAWTDGWDGYPAARQRFLDFVSGRRIANPVVLGGDVHSFNVNQLKLDFDDPASPVVASEFVCTSITSQAWAQERLNQYLPDNPHMLHSDSRFRGYARAEVGAKRMQVDLRARESVQR
ncbi:MAG: alkaline phosphatase D family protein, partial [Chloroflexi bacterium]|nr:alkaline phosphatase D family protein [Chloroflexota bacterium]